MNGKLQVMLLYTMPVFLSANAPNQNTLAIVSSLMSLCAPCFGVVLRMPCRGRFMRPLAVAGLGMRYFSISFFLMFGHPLRNPFRVAFNSVDILGWQSNWWANFTALARVLTECVKLATFTTVGCGVLPMYGPENVFGVLMTLAVGMLYVAPSWYGLHSVNSAISGPCWCSCTCVVTGSCFFPVVGSLLAAGFPPGLIGRVR